MVVVVVQADLKQKTISCICGRYWAVCGVAGAAGFPGGKT